MTKTLKDFKIGERGVVLSIHGEGETKRRMIDMGITPGAVIILKKYAPLGDPMEINVRGYNLALRKADAAVILLEVAE